MIKKIKNKHFLFLTFFIIFLFCISNSALALEVKLPGLSDNASIGDYAAFLFNFIIGLAGLLALISFTIGAIGLIASGDSTEGKKDAIDRMKGAILGLMLSFASFLIIQTINPQLLNFAPPTSLPDVNLPVPPRSAGVYFYPEAGCKGANSGAITGSQDNLKGFGGEVIKSFEIVDDSKNKVEYGVIIHKEEGLDNGGECSEPITGEGCKEASMDPGAANIFQIGDVNSGNGVNFYSEPFEDNMGAKAGKYEIPKDGIKGLISLYPDTMCFDYNGVKRPVEYKHKCTDSTCGGDPYSCDVRNPEACFGYGTCGNDEYCVGTNDLCADDSWCSGVCDRGTCVGPKGEKLCSKTACETFQDCHGSIQINGSYLVAVYSKEDSNAAAFGAVEPGTGANSDGGNNKLYCQTFTKDVPNLNATPMLAPGVKIDSIDIIPIN